MPGGAAGQAYRNAQKGLKYSGPPGTKPGAFGLPEPIPQPGTFQGIGSPTYNYGAPGKGPGFHGYEPGTYDPPSNLLGQIQQAHAAEYLRQVDSYNKRMANIRAKATEYAKLYNSRAQALLDAARGRMTDQARRLASYYGLDLAKKEGRRQAAILAKRLSDLAQNSYTERGAENLVTYENETRKFYVDQRNQQAADAARAAKKYEEGRSSFRNLFNPLKNPLNPLSTVGRALGVEQETDFGAGLGYFIPEAFKIAEPFFEWATRSYSAGKYSQLKGGSLAEQIGSMGAGLPGLGFLATDEQRKNIEATNTREERAALTDRGTLLSFGEAVTGDYSKLDATARRLAEGSQFDQTEANRQRIAALKDLMTVEINGTEVNLASGTIDFLFNIGQDPTFVGAKAMAPLRNVSRTLTDDAIRISMRSGASRETAEELARTARVVFVRGAPVGRSAVDEVVRVAENTQSVSRIVKAMGKATPRQLAHDVYIAGRDRGAQGAREVLEQAFIDGTWQPSQSLMRRTLGRMGYAGNVKGPVTARLGDVLRDVGAARTTKTVTLRTSVGELPEVADDMTRLFRGNRASGVAGNGEGAVPGETWLTSTLEDAIGYADGGTVQYIDVPTRHLDSIKGPASFSGETGEKLAQHYIVPRHESLDALGGLQRVTITEKRIKNVARSMRAPRSGSSPFVVIDWAIQHVANINKVFGGAIIARLKGNEALDMATRANNLIALADSTGSPGFRAAVDEVIDPLNFKLFEDLAPEAQERILNYVEKLEAIGHLLNGFAADGFGGDDISRLLRDQFDRQFSIEDQFDVTSTVKSLLYNKSQTKKFKLDAKVWRTIEPEDAAAHLDALPQDHPLRAVLAEELAAAIPGTQRYGFVVSAIDNVISTPRYLEEATRLLELNGTRDGLQALLRQQAREDTATMLSRFLRGGSNMLLSLAEKRTVPLLRTLSSPYVGENQRAMVDALDRYAGAMRLGAAERKLLAQDFERVARQVAQGGDPQKAFDLHTKLVELAFEKSGLSRDDARRWAKEWRQANKRPVQRYGVRIEDEYDELSVQLLDRPQVGAQAQTTFQLPEMELIREGIRKELQLQAKGSHWNDVRVWWDEAKNIQLLGGRSIKDGARGALTFWKVMVTTRLYMAPLIMGATFVATGDVWDSLQAGAAGGAFGLVRYTFRNSLQNRVAAVLEHGLVPEEHIWPITRAYKRQNRPIYGAGTNSLFTEDATNHWLYGRVGSRTRKATDEWVIHTPQNLKEFSESYFRVLNYQINPETDEVMRLVLMRKAGQLDDAGLKDSLAAFLKTEDGRLWLAKMKALGAGRKKAVSQYTAFVDQYVPDAGVAAMRLDPSVGMGPSKSIGHKQIQQWAKDGKLADAVHGQETVGFLHGGGHMAAAIKRAYRNAAYDTARAERFRVGFYNYEANRREAAFKAVGLGDEQAKQLAGEIATRRTNELIYRFDNGSRFSAAIDWIAPFSGERQFTLETWTKLAVTHPGRTIRVTRQAALAFNNGREDGLFQQDPYGNWTFTVPGSAWLSKHLFGMPKSFEGWKVKLTGFLNLSAELAGAPQYMSGPEQAAGVLLPHPGGPWWSVATKVMKEVHPELVGPDSPLPPALRSFLFPYGPQTALIPPDAQRMLRAMVGTSGPWGLLDDGQGLEELHRWELEMTKQLIAEHRKKHPGDLNWFPSHEEVRERTKAFFHAWSFFQNIMPAAPYPVFKSRDQFQELWDAWYLANEDAYDNFSEARSAFVRRYPVFAPFLDATTKYVGPDDYKHWSQPSPDFDSREGAEAYRFQRFAEERRYKSFKEYRDEFKFWRRQEAARRAFNSALNTPGDSVAREQAMQKYRDEFGDVNDQFRNEYNAEIELAHIMVRTPKSRMQEALDNWRRDYAPKGKSSLTYGQYQSMARKVRRNMMANGGNYSVNPWRLARDSEDVWRDVKRKVGTNEPDNWRVVAYVTNNLEPVEQVKFWQAAIINLNRTTNSTVADPDKVLPKYYRLRGYISDVYKTHDIVTPNRWRPPKDEWETLVEKVSQQERDLLFGNPEKKLSGLYADSREAKAALDRAFDEKRYGDVAHLKARYQGIKDLIRAVKNDFWRKVPQSKEMHEAVKELEYFVDIDAPASHINKLARKVMAASDMPWYPSSEEAQYLSMPTNIREAYLNDLVDHLNMPYSKGAYATASFEQAKDFKMYWNELTDFQRDLLERLVPRQVLDGWKGQDKETLEKLFGKGGDGRSFRGFGRRGFGGQGELSFAFEMLKKYNRRGNMPKPAAYDEYLALPNNPAVRNQFLEKHPEVAEYIKAGPMANMPVLYRMMVSDIMVRYGKWEGDPMETGELTDLIFAREQLERWNRRTGPAPDTYDIWLNMPSGQAKAQYMQAHPEIGQWLQLGPMANMPEAYREVVRDIMLRYHEWTAAEDGIGLLIQQYYRTPAYARQQFLADHPEIQVYWQAVQTPQQRELNDLANQFYSIADSGARQSFLQAHPELGQYFLESRTKRYERFLNQVAVYMGSSPELFRGYLENQERILGDLLKKFAEPNLVREQHWLQPAKAMTASTEGGRRRA